MGKKLYIVLHEHRFGITTYLVKSDHEPTEEEVVKACDIDFEPNRETIEIVHAGHVYKI